MQLIVNLVEILLLASGIFFLAAAFADGRLPRWAGRSSLAHLRGAQGPATLTPRTIRRTALD
jgi:hypothetical protein